MTLEADLVEALGAAQVAFDSATRAVYATDSSNYRQVPIGVLYPRDEADVQATLRIAADHDAPVLGRGGGTSLAGQGCNEALVLDFSRHMTAILAIDPVARTARVQPGVVLDDLRRAAETYDLTFGPDPATHAWCTLGGMVGNNSCGTHALIAGKTVDNVEALRVVLYGGEMLELGAYDEDAYVSAVGAGGTLAGILGGLREIGRRAEPLVAQRFPDIPRRVSGFNLDEITPGRPLHVARLLVGTESTCAITTEITVRLIPSPQHRILVVLGYPDVFDAADAVPEILTAPGLIGLEGIDDVLVGHMLESNLNTEHLGLLPAGRGWLFAELGADDAAAAAAHADALVASLPTRRPVPPIDYRRYDDPETAARVWLIRESGLGATAIRSDGTHNAEGWEDAAVHPERLGEYMRAMTALWRDYGYSGAWYGHFGQGCVHTRNNFDFATEQGLRDFREFVERATDLVVSLGGSISGEHGDGQARGELLTRQYGSEVVDLFRQVKALFDPRGRLNPGKVVDPYPLDANLRFGPTYRREAPGARRTSFALATDAGSLQQAAERCVGVGRCRRGPDEGGVMCPSYRATGDELHSTRGRAKLLVEMFQGEVTPATWRNDDVRGALDLCLSCKGCAVDCPTHVDMATYKAEFLSHYYRRRLRPREMYALGLIPWAARLATRMPRLTNAVLGAPGLGPLVRLGGGVTTRRPAPRFASRSMRRSARAGATVVPADATVVVWPDTFTDAFRPEVGAAVVEMLRAAGDVPVVPTEWACCGRPLYDGGMLSLARKTLLRLLDVLDPYVSAGLPVVVPEPSCLAAFRDELPGLLPDDPRAKALAVAAVSPAEHLLARLAYPAPSAAGASGAAPPERVLIHPHCHARADKATPSDRALLEALGYEVEVLDAGCCGLAGSFGYAAEHEALSRRIGEEQWLPRLRARAAAADHLVVDGFSCVMQLEHLGGPDAPEPTTLPALALRALTRH